MITAEATEIIDENIIENCEVNGACSEGLGWLREKPRTFAELKSHSKSWFNWLAENSSLPEVLSKLAEDANSAVRCPAKRRLAGL